MTVKKDSHACLLDCDDERMLIFGAVHSHACAELQIADPKCPLCKSAYKPGMLTHHATFGLIAMAETELSCREATEADIVWAACRA